MKLPHIVSAVNGIKIPLLPGQAGIMHRYTNPENRLVIASVHDQGAEQDDETRLQIAEPATPRAPRNKPKAEAAPAEAPQEAVRL